MYPCTISEVTADTILLFPTSNALVSPLGYSGGRTALLMMSSGSEVSKGLENMLVHSLIIELQVVKEQLLKEVPVQWLRYAAMMHLYHVLHGSPEVRVRVHGEHHYGRVVAALLTWPGFLDLFRDRLRGR